MRCTIPAFVDGVPHESMFDMQVGELRHGAEFKLFTHITLSVLLMFLSGGG